MTRPAIYLDHNASSPLLPEARAALVAALDLVGNPSIGAWPRPRRAEVDRDRARHRWRPLQAPSRQAGGVHRLGDRSDHPGHRRRREALRVERVVVSAGEHAAVLKAAEASGLPVITHWLSTVTGVIRCDALRAELDDHLAGLRACGEQRDRRRPAARRNQRTGRPDAVTPCSSMRCRLSASCRWNLPLRHPI